MSTEIPKKSREELLAARAAREAKAHQEKEANELLCLELEDRFSTELGPRGKAWALVNEQNDLGTGPIVVKLGSPVQLKLFTTAAQKGKLEGEDFFAFVAPSVVYPEAAVFKLIAVERALMVVRCAQALKDLYGDAAENESKKY